VTQPRVHFAQRPKSMRYISRQENEYQIGWYVVIGQRTGKQVKKFFGDGRHGGQRKALKAAKRFRDKSLRLFGSDGTRPISRRMTVNMAHGLPIGISYQRRKDPGRNGQWYWREYFQVYWKVDGNDHTKTFSVGRWGYREAKRRAIAWRKEHE
jgi:hypothetical protein